MHLNFWIVKSNLLIPTLQDLKIFCYFISLDDTEQFRSDLISLLDDSGIHGSIQDLCPYNDMDECPYQDDCLFVHGDLCNVCRMPRLHPLDLNRRIQHATVSNGLIFRDYLKSCPNYYRLISKVMIYFLKTNKIIFVLYRLLYKDIKWYGSLYLLSSK